MEPLRHGAYVAFRVSPETPPARTGAEVRRLADRLGLVNEFEAAGGDPQASYAFLRREGVAAGDVPDEGLEQADAVVHVAAPASEPVATFCAGLLRVLGPAAQPRVLRGVVRPMSYTGNELFNFSYAHRVLQQPGPAMPNAFLVPLNKTPAWWRKDWMERHTYILPRYGGDGRMVAQGHALAAADGIPHLLRRTYRPAAEPAPAGQYDFVSYFECADDGVSVFHAACSALRDTARNPEWEFVREGPTWQGRRLATWDELVAADHQAVVAKTRPV
jgi:hypothetical protein